MWAEHAQEIEAIRSEVASAVKQTERREAWQHTRIKNLETEKAQEKQRGLKERHARISAEKDKQELQKKCARRMKELEKECARSRAANAALTRQLGVQEKDLQASCCRR